MGTERNASKFTHAETIRRAHDENTGSLLVDPGFIMGKVGRIIEVEYAAPDMEIYHYLDSGVPVYDIMVMYTDPTKTDLSSVERIS